MPHAEKEKKPKKARKVEAEPTEPTEDTPMLDSILPPSAESTAAVETDTTTPSKKRKRTVLPFTETELEIDITAPEPPSKKDLRRLRKLSSKGIDVASLQAANVPILGEQNKGFTKDDPKPEQKHSPYGVWIGNLSFTTTREQLLAFFTGQPVTTTTGESLTGDANGANATAVRGNRNIRAVREATPEVEMKEEDGKSKTGITQKDITRINLPRSKRFPKQNSGFAYIDFRTASSIPPAVALSEKLLLGRKVLIKASTDFQGRPEKTVAEKELEVETKGGKPPSKSIFVGNLGFETTVEDLEEHFLPAGKIKKVRMTTFEDTGKCKGFGWIDFEDLESAKFALNGKPIESEDASGSDNEEDSKKSKKRQKKDKKPKLRKFEFLGSRRLRMEYAEDATTRYNKRHKGGERKDEEGGVDGERELRGPPIERKVDARTITPGAALAKAMEQRLTGRIVEGKGKKITFD